MPKINVTISELNNTANALEEMNRLFIGRVAELENLEHELNSMWQGEANDAFRNAFESDHTQWAEFAVIIQHYVNSLRNIAEQYSQAEADCVFAGKSGVKPSFFCDFIKTVDLMPFSPALNPTLHVIPGILQILSSESFLNSVTLSD